MMRGNENDWSYILSIYSILGFFIRLLYKMAIEVVIK